MHAFYLMRVCDPVSSLWIVLSCFWCRRNISRTWFTCDMFPSGRSTSSPSSKSSAWLCCGSSSQLWLLLSSLSWWETFRLRFEQREKSRPKGLVVSRCNCDHRSRMTIVTEWMNLWTVSPNTLSELNHSDKCFVISFHNDLYCTCWYLFWSWCDCQNHSHWLKISQM